MLYKNKKWLKQKYIVNKLPMHKMATLAKCDTVTIHNWMKRFDIPRRKSRGPMSEEEKEYRRQWNYAHPGIIRTEGTKASEETKLKMSLARRGSKNANWKGGITKITRGIRRSPEYLQWRKAVLKRDNHTCQECESKKKIHVHHKKPIKSHPHLIHDVKNGITLCEKCHMKKPSGRRISSIKRQSSGV